MTSAGLLLIAPIVAFTALAALLPGPAAPAGEQLPPAEVQRRSQILIGQLAALPVMGDDGPLDRWSDALELETDTAPTVRWDDAAVLGRRALLTLDQELLASLQAASAGSAPPPTAPSPASVPPRPTPLPPPPVIVAYDAIMPYRPYAAGALPSLPATEVQANQLATALVDAGEGVLAVNAAAAVATAAAAREPTLLAAVAQPLSARSGRLLLALAGGYAEPGIRILSEPFDRVQATWCRGDQAAAGVSIATLYDQAYRSFRSANPVGALVERAWVAAVQAYTQIFTQDAVAPIPWHEAIAIVVLPDLFQEILDAAADFPGAAAAAAAPIPSCGVLGGSGAAAAYRAWVLAGGAPPEAPAATLGRSGPLTSARLKLIGALWLMDRCLDDITGTPATAAVAAARVTRSLLAPLRTLSIAVPGVGVGDAAITAISTRLLVDQAKAAKARSALLDELADWHPWIDATPDPDGWNLTAARTRRYCVAVAVLAAALGAEHAEHAVLDFLALQRDVAAVLSTTLRSAVVVGSPLLCEHIRATRIGAYLVASDLAAKGRFSVGAIPPAAARPLFLPPKFEDETDAMYWQRVCLTVIFPSFACNAMEETMIALAPVWLRMRAGATRQASLVLDHLGVCAWTIRALAASARTP